MEDAPQLADYGISRRGLFKTGLAVGLGAVGLSLAGTALTAGTAQRVAECDDPHLHGLWGRC